jgi:hypothetical protein
MFETEIQALLNQLSGIATRLGVDNERVDTDRQVCPCLLDDPFCAS